MAWNEPGGSPKNPWGKRPGESGDDAFRKFQRKLDNIMNASEEELLQVRDVGTIAIVTWDTCNKVYFA